MAADAPNSLTTAEATTPAQQAQTRQSRAAAAWWWPANVLEQIASIVLVLALFAGAVLVLMTVVGRATSTSSLDLRWSGQAGVLMLNILTFIGGAVGYRRKEFAYVEWLDRFLPDRVEPFLQNFRDTIIATFSGVLAVYACNFVIQARSETDAYLNVSEFWLYVSLPIGAFMILIFSLERLLLAGRMRILGISLGVALVFILVPAAHNFIFAGAGPTTSIIYVSVLAFLLLVFGVPLPFAFGVGGLTYIYFAGIPSSVASLDLLDANSSFILVAIPFFLFVGFIMSEAKLSDRLINALHILLRRIPGSAMQVIIFGMFVFSGISGSKIGDMAAVGTSAVRIAKREDYQVSEAVAVLAAGSAMGDTVPPSIGLIVLSSISGLSVAALFVGGILPAVITLIALCALIWIRFRHRPHERTNLSLARRVKVVALALPVLIVPIILIGGIVSGIATPTETSAVAVAVSVVMVLGVYRGITLAELYRVTVKSAVVSGIVLFIVATATLFARVLTQAGVPQAVASLVAKNEIGGRWGFMLVSIVVLAIFGMIMEGLPAYLVFAPLLIPVAAQLGINALQYGIVVVMAIGIGCNAPPIGIGLYVGAQIGSVPIKDVAGRMRPYVITLVVALLIVAAAPSVVTWLPSALHIAP